LLLSSLSRVDVNVEQSLSEDSKSDKTVGEAIGYYYVVDGGYHM
jgi:hypothetical protein